MFRRIAIVNRGEAAMRLIHAVRDHNASGGAPIETVALYTDSDSNAMFVREADLAHPLGPASARPYLDMAVLERALRATGADAVWPGWGFVAEDPAFVDLCDRIGVKFIGPSAEAMRKLGDKIGSKLIAEEVGVPVAPWSRGAVGSLEEALEAAENIGYPLMLKATAGGGGRGIRMVDSAAALEDAFQRTADEAQRAFGSGVVFLERLVTGARHVEVQVIADGHGTAWAIGVRDCSVQRRNQKVIEESASPLLSREQSDELKASAERLAVAVGYQGAGTVEFLYHPGEKTFAFLEVNTRLQVEHSITEVTTGMDLVRAQLHVAAGGRLEGEKPLEVGHAVEARLNAEDPDREFAPAPGRIARLELPMGPGVRVDTGVGRGRRDPPDFDSMIAKIIASGRNREEALGRLRRAMAETTVVIEGGVTNKSFILDLLDQPEIVDGTGGWADTSWIDRVRSEGRLVLQDHSGVALVAAAIEAYREEAAIELARLLETAHGGRPQVQHEVGRPVELKLRGTVYAVTTVNIGPNRYAVTVAHGEVERTVDVTVDLVDEHHRRLIVGGARYRVVTAKHGPTTLVEVDGVAHQVSRDEGGVLRSPAPALVVARPVAVGDTVEAGAPSWCWRAMKMETVLHAPFAAVVQGVPRQSPVGRSRPGRRWSGWSRSGTGPSEVVAEVAKPAGSRAARRRGVEASFAGVPRSARADLSALMLGYDLAPQPGADALARLRSRPGGAARRGRHGRRRRDRGCWACSPTWPSCSSNRPADEEPHTELRVHSPQGALPHLPAEPRRRAGRASRPVPRAAAGGAPPLRRHRARPDAGARGGGLPDLPRPAAVGARGEGGHRACCSTGSPSRHPEGELAPAACDSSWSGSPVPPSDGSRWSVTWPGACGSAGSTSRWSTRSGPACSPACATRWPRSPRTATCPTGPSGSRRWRPSRSRSSGSSPNGWSTGCPRASRCSRCWCAATTGSSTCTTCGPSRRVDGERPFVVADYTLDARPTRLVSTVGTVDELAEPGAAACRALAAQVAERRAGEEAVVDLYLQWDGAPRPPTRRASSCGRLVAALAVRRTSAAGSRWRSAPAANGRSATSRSDRDPTASWRTTWSAASTRWWGAG